MAKLTLTDLASLTNETSAITTINNNNEAIETALENTLSRNGTSPNSMGAQLDMNTHKIINLAQGAGAGEALEYTQLQDYIDETAADRALIDASVAAASASATAAFNSAGAAAGSAEDAADILIEVQNIFDTYNNQYLGTFAGDPTVDNDGNPLTVGDIWYNSITLSMRVWDGTQAQDVATMTPTSTNTITNKIYQSAVFRNTFVPDTNDGAAIGTTSLKFSDLFLASGAVINFDSGDVTLTHSADTLTFAGLSNIVLPTSTRLSWDAGTYIYGDTSSGIIRYLSDNLGIQNNSAHVFYVDGAIRVTLNGAALYPSTSSPIALGDPAAPFSNLSLGSGSVINLNNGDVTLTHSSNNLAFAGGTYQFDGEIYPTTNDGAPLGDTTHNWSDLFLASGAVINFNNGDYTLTHSTGVLTANKDLRITTVGTNSASVVTVGGTQNLTNKTLTSAKITTNLGPTSNDGAALGDTTHNFSDLFLATGAVINFNNSNYTLTHSSGVLTASADLRVTTPGSNSASVTTLAGGQTLTGGFSATSFSDGTVTTGTLTPSASSGNFHHYTNNGAHTLAPPSTVCTIVVECTNGASAGTITTSGFTKVTGDTLNTTNANKFAFFITKTNSYSHLQIQALQ